MNQVRVGYLILSLALSNFIIMGGKIEIGNDYILALVYLR